MPIETNKSAVRSYFEHVLNRGHMDAADAIFAADIQFHYPLGEQRGIEAVKGYVEAVRKAFPDIRFTVADLFGEGERIAARWSLLGTQTSELLGNPPTGKKVSVTGNTIFHVVDGKIREIWIAFDPARLL